MVLKVSKATKAFRNTSLMLILLAGVVLGVLYLYTLAAFLAQPPSAGFSREVAIATVDYGFISNIQTPVVTVANNDDTLTVVAMDGHQTSLVTLDAAGTIRDSFHIDLDLYKASQLGAYRQDENTLVLYYVENDLFMATVDVQSHTYKTTMVEPQVKSFVFDGSLLVLEKANGLFGYDTSRERAPVPLVTGEILDYAATIDDNACYVLAGIRNDQAMDLKTIVADRSFEEVQYTLILGKTRDNYLKTIQDVFVQDQVMTGLFVWTDNKYGLNHLTVQHIDQGGKVCVHRFDLSKDYNQYPYNQLSVPAGYHSVCDIGRHFHRNDTLPDVHLPCASVGYTGHDASHSGLQEQGQPPECCRCNYRYGTQTVSDLASDT